jgi:hypothetical protein
MNIYWQKFKSKSFLNGLSLNTVHERISFMVANYSEKCDESTWHGLNSKGEKVGQGPRPYNSTSSMIDAENIIWLLLCKWCHHNLWSTETSNWRRVRCFGHQHKTNSCDYIQLYHFLKLLHVSGIGISVSVSYLMSMSHVCVTTSCITICMCHYYMYHNSQLIDEFTNHKIQIY